MTKWLILFVFALQMLPYRGAISLRIPEPHIMRSCDGPCSPINPYIFIPCRADSCFSRAKTVPEHTCKKAHGPRYETIGASVPPAQEHICLRNQIIVQAPITPTIPTHILSVQKRE